MNKQETKAAKIRQWLMSGKPLTQWECTFRFKYLDLASLVRDMRRAGHNITTEMVNADNGTHYGVYQLQQPKVDYRTTKS